ncbi:MAG: hydrogenase expression/formation C-terminal domain-containing protein [Betaproteobacteria bacterium]|jgi:hydrogenase-1 operon protein HyaF
MALEHIPVIPVPSADPLTGNAPAVLSEIAGLLAGLAERNEGGVIDLAGMPLSQSDKEWLTEKLGQGEIAMTLDLDGASEVRETAFPGVWWLVHHNEKGVLTGEFIEVGRVPSLVPAHPDDIQDAARRLGFVVEDLYPDMMGDPKH